jgi:large subunit ribosomal protein L9
MKVILKQTVPNVGKEGQVVKVKDGFARNFLFPKGMAVVADKAQTKVLEARNARLEKQLAETKDAAAATAEKLNGKHVRMEVRSGTNGRLFGAVTSQDIADAIKSETGVELDKKTVGILQPIKQLGHFAIEIDLHGRGPKGRRGERQGRGRPFRACTGRGRAGRRTGRLTRASALCALCPSGTQGVSLCLGQRAKVGENACGKAPLCTRAVCQAEGSRCSLPPLPRSRSSRRTPTPCCSP